MESAFSAAEGLEFGGGFELPGAADEDSVSGGCAMEVVEECFLFHTGLCLPFFTKSERICGDDSSDFKATDQGHSRAGYIDEDEVTQCDLWADAAEFDGFGASEDKVCILRLDGHEDGLMAHEMVLVP
jgi:hypothetical protein